MQLSKIKGAIPSVQHEILLNEIQELRPAQAKAVDAGLLKGNNVLVCTPTASGKTLIAELASLRAIIEQKKKVVYIVPLKALATEKYKHIKQRYGEHVKVAISIGNMDSADKYLENYDFIVTTSEKLDSLLRHHTPWIQQLGVVVIDEIHLLNDPGRGPTLEIIITLLRQLVNNIQLVGLSATIGNPQELASWLDAELVEDDWRPVKLEKGIYHSGEIEFYDQ